MVTVIRFLHDNCFAKYVNTFKNICYNTVERPGHHYGDDIVVDHYFVCPPNVFRVSASAAVGCIFCKNRVFRAENHYQDSPKMSNCCGFKSDAVKFLSNDFINRVQTRNPQTNKKTKIWHYRNSFVECWPILIEFSSQLDLLLFVIWRHCYFV